MQILIKFIYFLNIRMKQIPIDTNKRKDLRLEKFNNTDAFIEYSNVMDYIYEKIEEYNPDK